MLTIPGDINNKTDRGTLIERTIEKFGKLDVLVRQKYMSIQSHEMYNFETCAVPQRFHILYICAILTAK